MDVFYPEPPHLTVAVYPGLTEAACFAAMCEVAEQAGCTTRGVVEVAPWRQAFELRADLTDVIVQMRVSDEQFGSIVAGHEDSGRPVRAAYVHPTYGTVVVEYLLAYVPDEHPIAISLGAGPIGFPPELWQDDDREYVKRLEQWAMDLLERASLICEAPYGSIAVEVTLPTPSSLRGDDHHFAEDLFVSNAVLASSDEVLDALRADYRGGREIAWHHGLLFSAWEPSKSEYVTLAGIPTGFRASSQALGRALQPVVGR